MTLKIKDSYQKFSLAEPFILEPEDWSAQEWAALCKLCDLPVSSTERIVLHASVLECFENLEKNAEDTGRTYTVTEVCPHCGSEVEMRWDTDTMGFKAFCPVCGQRLMLCDECRHTEPSSHCDYDNQLDCCHRNPPTPEPMGAKSPKAQTDAPLEAGKSDEYEGYIVSRTATLAVGMIVDLGNGPATENGDRSSQYFTIAKGRRNIGRMVSVSLVENINGLPEGKGYYTLHLVDDVSGSPCELYHTKDLSEGALIDLLAEILDGLEKGGKRI